MMAAVGTALVLAGCSGGPEPVEPTAGASPSTSESATPAPTMPAQASGLNDDSASGAATFAQYWINMSDYASLTGDVDELRRLSAPQCGGCFKYIDLYEETYLAGGRFTGGEQTLSDVRVDSPGDNTRSVFATLELDRGEFKETSDAEVQSVAAESNQVVFTVARSDDRWMMQAFELREPRS